MSIDLQIKTTHSEICQQAAKEIAEQIRNKPDSTIGLATGNTMEPIYTELVRMHKEEGLDFSQVKFFNLDEFKDIEPTDEKSFDYYLHNLFLNKINAKEENIHLVSGKDFDTEAYEQEIKNAGGIDIQLLGIGREGHIGFNEANDAKSTLDSRTREVELAKSTREDGAGTFGGEDKVPTHAYTQGIGTISDAKKLIMIVNGGHKANIAKEMLTQGEVTQNPARAILKHPNVSLYTDKPSAELLSDEQLKIHGKMEPAEIAAHHDYFTPIRIPMEDGTEVTLPYNADIFLPDVMKLEEAFDPENPAHLKGFREMMANTKTSYIGAHPDDAELWCAHEIENHIEGLKEDKKHHFLNVVVTDGGSYVSALKREGKYAGMTPELLINDRKMEQRKVCEAFGYPTIMLQYPSKTLQGEVSKEKFAESVGVLQSIYDAMPSHEISYHHHAQDKHRTHVGCANASAHALGNSRYIPKASYAMPAWGHNAFTDSEIHMKDASLIDKLLKYFDSQISLQGRGYDFRGVANVVANGFFQPFSIDKEERDDKGEKIILDGNYKAFDITEAVRDKIPLISYAKEKAMAEFGMLEERDKNSSITRNLGSKAQGPERFIKEFSSNDQISK